MPFAILPVGERYGVYKIHPDGSLTLSGIPRYVSEKTAAAAASRWMRYRGEQAMPRRNSLGELILLQKKW